MPRLQGDVAVLQRRLLQGHLAVRLYNIKIYNIYYSTVYYIILDSLYYIILYQYYIILYYIIVYIRTILYRLHHGVHGRAMHLVEPVHLRVGLLYHIV